MLLEWSEVLGIMFNVFQIYLFIEFIYNTLDSTVYTNKGYIFQQIVNTTGKIYYLKKKNEILHTNEISFLCIFKNLYHL